jgi:hypothetical protein
MELISHELQDLRSRLLHRVTISFQERRLAKSSIGKQ